MNMNRRGFLGGLIALVVIGIEHTEVFAKKFGWNVKRFGAVGDGRIDDTAAFQKALDAATKHDGFVFVPPGTYRLENPIDLGDIEDARSHVVNVEYDSR